MHRQKARLVHDQIWVDAAGSLGIQVRAGLALGPLSGDSYLSLRRRLCSTLRSTWSVRCGQKFCLTVREVCVCDCLSEVVRNPDSIMLLVYVSSYFICVIMSYHSILLYKELNQFRCIKWTDAFQQSRCCTRRLNKFIKINEGVSRMSDCSLCDKYQKWKSYLCLTRMLKF